MRTYGRLRYAENEAGRGFWCVDKLAPHVSIAFKRLFKKIRMDRDSFILSDTDDLREDLHWFMLRYPFETKEIARLEEGIARQKRRAADRDAILDLEWTPGELARFNDGKAPYLYQAQAAEVALTNPDLLLVDDAGLGKTVSTFAVAADPRCPLPMAIVVEPHIARQWSRRASEFTNLRTHIIKQMSPYTLPSADLYIFSYSKLAGWPSVFDSGKFKSVAYDEIQKLRHGTSTNMGHAAHVLSSRAQLRLGLTATPIYNYGDEIYTIMDYIHPGLLGDRDEFRREWCGGEKGVKDPDALGSFLQESGFMLRRDEDHPSVDASMPPPNILDFELDWDDAAVEKEEELLRRLATTVLRGRFEESGQAARELDVRMRHLTGVAKARQVALYVEMLLRENEKVALIGWHRDVYDIWLGHLARFNPVLYTGSETAAGKDRSVRQFVEGDSRVFIGSLRSGAGLDDIQYACWQMVFGELDWSPQVHYQWLRRLRRPGQTQQVTGHFLHTNGGSDPVLMSMLGRKSDQSRGIVDPGKELKQRHVDVSRVKALARYVLGEEE